MSNRRIAVDNIDFVIRSLTDLGIERPTALSLVRLACSSSLLDSRATVERLEQWRTDRLTEVESDDDNP